MNSIFVSDLDGTLLMGDTCNGGKQFTGLVQALYENRLVPNTKHIPKTYKDWREKYFTMLNQFDTSVCKYPLNIYTGTPEQEEFIETYWDNVFSKWFVPFTRDYLQQKSKTDEIWILSGSPTCFIYPIVKHLPFVSRVIGIEKGDIITYGYGKVLKIQSLIDLENISGYIGDVWQNDGPLMTTLKSLDNKKDIIYIEHGQTNSVELNHLQKWDIRMVHGF